MKIIADTHTHTLASTHAYSTAQEMVTAAKEKGLYAIALTDHAYRMPGAPGEWFFENLHAIPPTLYGVRVLRGMEANVIDFDGNLDAPQDIQKRWSGLWLLSMGFYSTENRRMRHVRSFGCAWRKTRMFG